MGDPTEIVPGLSHTDAGTQPPHHSQVMSPFFGLGRRNISLVVLQWRPHLRRRRKDIVESARHDANYGVAVVVELDLASDDAAVSTEVPLPQTV